MTRSAPTAASLSGLPALSITGGGGNDTLDLSAHHHAGDRRDAHRRDAAAHHRDLHRRSAFDHRGGVRVRVGAPAITFTGIPNLIGTSAGGDYFFAGSGTESMTEIGSPGTLDYSAVPVPPTRANNVQGIIADATDLSGTPGGTVTSPATIGVTDTFTQIGTFNGTRDNDTFMQSGPGSYNFNGGAGANTLDLSDAPAGTAVSLTAPSAGCTTGIKNNNGTATGSDVTDNFTCMGSVISSSSEDQVLPRPDRHGQRRWRRHARPDRRRDRQRGDGEHAVGTGGLGTVTGDGYNFSFTGMSTVDGTPYNDLFIPGTASVIVNGDGGVDGVSFAGAPSAAVVNLSSSSYTVPSGALTDAGTTVPADTAMGGYGGTITLNGISNVTGTATHNDIIVGGPGSGTLDGGSGDDTFVPSGGNYFITGGTGTNTLDLSLLPSYSTLNLGSPARSCSGTGTVSLTVAPGTIQKVIASPSGSTLQAGPGQHHPRRRSGQ